MANLTLERIRYLADPGSFELFQPLPNAGFTLGRITVDDRPVHVLAADIDTPLAIPAIEAFSRVSAFIEQIRSSPAPLVSLLDVQANFRSDSGKTLIPPGGLELLAHDRGMGRIYSGLARLEGVAPRIAVILGPTGASRSFPAALCDATVMLKSAALCLGRPDAVQRMIGQPTTFAKLGGPLVQADASGTVHKVMESERGALAWAREWLSHMPTRAGETPSAYPSHSPRGDIAAVGNVFERDLNAAVDMHILIDALVDGGSWLEMGERHAAECMTGLARIDGCSVGIVANNAAVRGGILYPETCRKMTRFIHFCGKFELPLVFLADTPGFMVGEDVERRGIVQAASDLYTAIALCPSARVCIVVRKAYSAGLYAMAGPGFDSTFWVTPKASVSIFGPEALRRFQDGQMETGAYCGADAMDEMLQTAMDPSILADKELVDGILQWSELRERLSGFVRQAPAARH